MTDHAAFSSEAVALADRIGELVACMRSAEAELGALLVEIEQRGVMELFGYRSAARLLEHLADVPKPAAERMVKRARLVNAGRNLDGSPVPALAPATGAAALAGRLSTPMIDVITGVLAEVPPEHRDSAETNLLTFAEDAGHKQVAALGARILAHLAPDGQEPDDTEPATPPRELFLRRKRSGIWELNAKFDDETGTRASALLDALAERRTGDEGPDHRTHPQRYGDAFSDAVDLALNSPDLPMQAGERAHVMVAVSLEDLKSGVGTATLGDTGTMSAAEARIHACDAMVIPAVLGAKSEPRLRAHTHAGQATRQPHSAASSCSNGTKSGSFDTATRPSTEEASSAPAFSIRRCNAPEASLLPQSDEAAYTPVATGSAFRYPNNGRSW